MAERHIVDGVLIESARRSSTGSSTTPKQGSTTTVNAPAAAPAGTSFKNNVLTTKDIKIKITDVKTIQAGEEGNKYGSKPVIAFWYDTTDLSGKQATPMEWMFHFNAYQDNDPNAENKLSVGSLPDSAFLDSQMSKIKKNGTVSNAVAYELSDTKTPVKLVSATLFGDEIGSMTVKLK